MPQDDQRATAERQTFWILVTISVWMTAWIAWRFAVNPSRYVERGLGINENLAAMTGWIWLPALAIAAAYAAYTLWAVPGARAYTLRLDALGLVAIWAAVASGVLEEVLFRQRLMDWLAGLGHSPIAQVLISGIAFGVAHTLWVLLTRHWRIIVSVVASTTALGLALAVLYVATDRSTAPAIAAHIVINFIIEPGLILTVCLAGIRARQEPDATHDDAPHPDALANDHRATQGSSHEHP